MNVLSFNFFFWNGEKERNAGTGERKYSIKVKMNETTEILRDWILFRIIKLLKNQ